MHYHMSVRLSPGYSIFSQSEFQVSMSGQLEERDISVMIMIGTLAVFSVGHMRTARISNLFLYKRFIWNHMVYTDRACRQMGHCVSPPLTSKLDIHLGRVRFFTEDPDVARRGSALVTTSLCVARYAPSDLYFFEKKISRKFI